jgi:hypothetical protein
MLGEEERIESSFLDRFGEIRRLDRIIAPNVGMTVYLL